ncbi:MAG: Integral rane sensor signal transduction histidine kinase [Verrucomicrobiales bacterium]|nr:Integral rane sensor signal transduction histidine kinase [Verrucomicrobiales bacterium]
MGFILLLAQFSCPGADPNNSLEIQWVTENGKDVPIQNHGTVSLSSFPEKVGFGFGPRQGVTNFPIRLRYMLDPFENVWHEDVSEMTLVVRFYNAAGDQISQCIYSVNGETTGWTGSLKTSSLTHRRETLVVPPKASRLLVVISSAGPPDTVGLYVVANLVVSRSSGNLANEVLLESPFENELPDSPLSDPPKGWMHDGVRPSMAKIVKFGQDPQTRAFAILDEDPSSHGEWHSTLETAPAVSPGDSLVVEWNEMYSMGSGRYREARYGTLPAGNYHFRVRSLDVLGVPTGVEASLNVLVFQPVWKRPWFWAACALLGVASVLGAGRYAVWNRMRREMVRMQHQRALEQERLRIAHDIHDDLGARVTQISLLSAMAQDDPALSIKAREDFGKISCMARELVSALYETVWAVNPENDNLEAQGSYLCQMVKQLCDGTTIRCRFYVTGLPREVQVPSQIRHNINMAVKEAVHNVIKHSTATEITLRMDFVDGVLTISILDDGIGFVSKEYVGGHGLANMKQRMANIRGNCEIDSNHGRGTIVRIQLAIIPQEANV